MKTIPLEEYVKEWKEFLEFRKKKIALNMESKEYKESKESWLNSFDDIYSLSGASRMMMEMFAYKGAYAETFEGMLSWIADGKPIDK